MKAFSLYLFHHFILDKWSINQFVTSNHQTMNLVFPNLFHKIFSFHCFGPIKSLLYFSNAQTEKKLEKTKLVFWWIDVTNKIFNNYIYHIRAIITYSWLQTTHESLLTQWRYIYKWVNSAPIFFDRNYFELLLVLSSLQNSEFLKLIISFFLYFGAKIEISGSKWVEKTPIYTISTFGSKVNEFERKKMEKN